MARVLVVDDDLNFLSHITPALAAEGYHVQQTDNGEDAKNLLIAETFDLLITDILMTHITGLDLIDVAIASNINVRVLAVSGGGENDNGVQLLTEAMECGADGILQKPFSVGELLRTVRAIL